MGLLKKNLTFTVVVVVSLFVFIAGAYLAYAESSQIDKAKQKISSAESQLNNMRFADPAPTDENVAASQQNVDQLQSVLKQIRDDLQRGARLDLSDDGIGVMAGIQQYISEYRRKAAAHIGENGEPAPIALPNGFGFGFEQYLKEATMLDDAKLIPVLDQQRQILSYLLNQLYKSDPASIESIQRELLEQKTAASSRSGASNTGDKGFKIKPAVSAKVPGAIDTLAFSLTFTGYTNTLREFLNELTKFDLPIVVRSIEVKRPSGQSTIAAAPTQNNNLDAIFGVFGGRANTAQAEPEEAQKPIITENISTFTIVLEFIEIVLPANAAQAVNAAEDNA